MVKQVLALLAIFGAAQLVAVTAPAADDKAAAPVADAKMADAAAPAADDKAAAPVVAAPAADKKEEAKK